MHLMYNDFKINYVLKSKNNVQNQNMTEIISSIENKQPKIICKVNIKRIIR